ncbi:MAG: hypothetical protein ABW048_08765 [Sphingobium sp.]
MISNRPSAPAAALFGAVNASLCGRPATQCAAAPVPAAHLFYAISGIGRSGQTQH